MAYKIKQLRESKDMSQTKLAEISGISRGTINKLENLNDSEQAEIKIGTLKAIAKALDVSVSELLS